MMMTIGSTGRDLRSSTRALAALALAALVLAGATGRAAAEDAAPAAAPTEQDAPPAAPAAAGADEVQRFCSNIVDAARDRRYALQAEELKKLQADIDERMKALEAKRLEYEAWLKRRDDFLAKAEDNVVKIYAKMKPDAAAERLAEVKVELAAGILMKLDPRQASTILNEMDSKVAAVLTGVMATAARKVDPS
jgi:flagellar motility protein MotE (MotC chaperone)